MAYAVYTGLLHICWATWLAGNKSLNNTVLVNYCKWNLQVKKKGGGHFISASPYIQGHLHRNVS